MSELELKQFHVYKVVYRTTHAKRNRIAQMQFIGEDGDALLFNARPVAGTQRLPREWIQSAEEVTTWPEKANRYIGRIHLRRAP